MNTKDKSYGISKQNQTTSVLDRHIENLKIDGYTIIENVFNAAELEEIRTRLDKLLIVQEEEFGKKNLESINEANLVRCPLAYDDHFMKLAIHDKVLEVVRSVMGNYFVLHLQNGIINMPNLEHHQSSWHRDLPYQDFVISQPLALSALYCIDDFTAETGGTLVLPFSHRLEMMPSQDYVHTHELQTSVKAGCVILFDSMMYHKAGFNSSQKIRRGINHIYVAGILKQQLNFPAMLKGKFSDDPFLRMFLGYESETPTSVVDWRERQMKKKRK